MDFWEIIKLQFEKERHTLLCSFKLFTDIIHESSPKNARPPPTSPSDLNRTRQDPRFPHNHTPGKKYPSSAGTVLKFAILSSFRGTRFAKTRYISRSADHFQFTSNPVLMWSLCYEYQFLFILEVLRTNTRSKNFALRPALKNTDIVYRAAYNSSLSCFKLIKLMQSSKSWVK